jgi:hypothetical protein
VPSVSRRALERRIRYGLYGGGVITAAVVIQGLGLRPDLPSAVGSFPFWMKWTYTVSVGVCAMIAVGRLARPTPSSLHALWFLAVPVLLLAGIGIGELASTPTREWAALWRGGSWTKCPWIVLGLAMPMLLGLFWSFRRFAPQRMRAAGAVAGLASGAWAATIYCLHCPEAAAIFVLTWYSLGMLLAAMIGAVLGPRLMRW